MILLKIAYNELRILFYYLFHLLFISDSLKIKELDKLPLYELSKIYLSFNRWDFPYQLKSIKPFLWIDNDDSRPMHYFKGIYSEAIRKYILKMVGSNEISRVHNNKRMNKAQHDLFWDENGDEITRNDNLPYKYMMICHDLDLYKLLYE